MDVRSFLLDLKNKPLFYIMFCSDSELRPIYINKFVEAHGGKPVYKEDFGLIKQPRVLGKKPVYVVHDWEPAIKKPKAEYMKVNYPVLLVYTSKEPSEAVKETYKGHLVVIPEVTGEQASNLLLKIGLQMSVIDYLKSKTSSTQEAILLGRQVMDLAKDLSLSPESCFERYFKQALLIRNLDEEPTEFLQSILDKNYDYVYQYLWENYGNELFVFGCVLNWIENIIKFCSCTGDYWNDAGLVAAVYNPLKQARVNRIPFLTWIRIYELGISLMQSIKINEPEPSSALEVFICHIIRTLS